MNEETEVEGTSLWQNAWRRLRRNRLAMFGMIVTGLIVAVSLVGPPIIATATGYTYDYIPSRADLIRSFPPLSAPDGSFSLSHPMGTDSSGRDILARVLLGGRISLMVGIISTLVSLIIGIAYGATAGYMGGHVDDVIVAGAPTQDVEEHNGRSSSSRPDLEDVEGPLARQEPIEQELIVLTQGTRSTPLIPGMLHHVGGWISLDTLGASPDLERIVFSTPALCVLVEIASHLARAFHVDTVALPPFALRG